VTAAVGEDAGTSEYDPLLECRVAFVEDTARVQPMGEVDLATAPLVEERLEDVRTVGARHVILDLREALFVDSTVLHLALAWQERARRERFTFAVMVGPGPVRRAIDAAGIGAVLTIVSPAP
jgi:anti-anti-sigma factor